MLFASFVRSVCLAPIDKLAEQVGHTESLAHLAQAEIEAVRLFDAAVSKIQEWVHSQAKSKPGEQSKPMVKPLHVVKPAELTSQTYLETEKDVEVFLDTLRKALKAAILENKRIQIR